MTWDVRVRARAEADIAAARDWYESKEPGLGEAFVDEAANVLVKLRESPLRQPEYYRGLRRVFLTRFPYKVFYRVDGPTVIVLRVLHGHQDHVRRFRP